MLTEATRKTRTILPREKFSTGSSRGKGVHSTFSFLFLSRKLSYDLRKDRERERERVIIFESFCGRLEWRKEDELGELGWIFAA